MILNALPGVVKHIREFLWYLDPWPCKSVKRLNQHVAIIAWFNRTLIQSSRFRKPPSLDHENANVWPSSKMSALDYSDTQCTSRSASQSRFVNFYHIHTAEFTNASAHKLKLKFTEVIIHKLTRYWQNVPTLTMYCCEDTFKEVSMWLCHICRLKLNWCIKVNH